jgi:hypothetical protein
MTAGAIERFGCITIYLCQALAERATIFKHPGHSLVAATPRQEIFGLVANPFLPLLALDRGGASDHWLSNFRAAKKVIQLLRALRVLRASHFCFPFEEQVNAFVFDLPEAEALVEP